MKKILWFILGGLITIVLYLIGIGIYTRVSDDPIIFFASLIIAIIIVIIVCMLMRKVTKQLFDAFTIFVMGIVYCMGIVILAVFGPTFIDRSISYHIAFYATEEDIVYVEDIEEAFSKDIFDKRMHDAVATGFLTLNKDGSMSPTFKAKAMYYILEPLGKLTGSIDTYYDMKAEIQNGLISEKEN